MTNNRGQKYPFLERTAFNPGSINLVITICDYDEEKEKEKETKILDRFFNAVGPGLPRNDVLTKSGKLFQSLGAW